MYLERNRVSVSKGRELGTGGEGGVYEAVGMPGKVLKLYHKPLQPPHIAKLRALVKLYSKEIEQVAAFPSDLVCDGNGKVIGFLMPFVDERPLHELYNTIERRNRYPGATYQFIVLVARNVAAAFDTLHKHGIVVGDVNQNNVMFHPKKGTVRFVDCDSFQVRSGNAVHRCLVGVDHFTPPELQSKPFGSFDRTINHDAFGMAVLVFHLLTLGRHPFAGMYKGPGEMPSIADNIKNCQFPFAIQAPPNLVPPPKSITLQNQPPAIARLFTKAFSATSTSSQNGRPTAAEWGNTLSEMYKGLRQCDVDESHFSPLGNGHCLWCELEAKQGITAFASYVDSGSLNDLEHKVRLLHEQIAMVLIPQNSWDQVIHRIPKRQVSEVHVHIPDFMPDPGQLWLCRFLRYAVLGGSCIAFAFAWTWIGLVVCALLTLMLYAHFLLVRRSIDPTIDKELDQNIKIAEASLGKAMKEERLAFESILRAANEEQEKASQLWKSWEAFSQNQAITSAIQKQNQHEIERQAYLSSVMLSQNRSFGITDSMCMKLAYYNITSAADIETEGQLCQIHGIGPKSAKKLLAWKQSVVQSFRPNPQFATTIDQKLLASRRSSLRTLQRSLQVSYSRMNELRRNMSEYSEKVSTSLKQLIYQRDTAVLVERLYNVRIKDATQSGVLPRIPGALVATIWSVNLIALLSWTAARTLQFSNYTSEPNLTSEVNIRSAVIADSVKSSSEAEAPKKSTKQLPESIVSPKKEDSATLELDPFSPEMESPEASRNFSATETQAAGTRLWHIRTTEKELGIFVGRKRGAVMIRLHNGNSIEIRSDELAKADQEYLMLVEFREWKSNDGRSSRRARMLSEDGQSVELEYENGQIKKIPINRLRSQDRDWIKNPSYELAEIRTSAQ